MEFCSGPGFIGLGLLASKICSELVLIDVNKKLKKNLDKTIKQNNLNQTVSYFFGNGLSALKSKKKFVLIVSNPPHIDLNNKRFKLPPQTKKINWDRRSLVYYFTYSEFFKFNRCKKIINLTSKLLNSNNLFLVQLQILDTKVHIFHGP